MGISWRLWGKCWGFSLIVSSVVGGFISLPAFHDQILLENSYPSSPWARVSPSHRRRGAWNNRERWSSWSSCWQSAPRNYSCNIHELEPQQSFRVSPLKAAIEIDPKPRWHIYGSGLEMDSTPRDASTLTSSL